MLRPRFPRHSPIVFAALCTVALSAEAGEPDAGPGSPGTESGVNLETAEPRYLHVIQGFFGAAEIGTSSVGGTVMAELGFASRSIRALRNPRWLLQWDGSLAATGGILVKTLPIIPLIGTTASAGLEAGYRFGDRPWTAYLGGGAEAGLRAVTSTETPFSRLATLGALDGVGGISAGGAVRILTGASWMRGEHLLLLSVFGQSALRLPVAASPPIFFNGGGIRVRWDISRKLTAYVTGFIGLSPRAGIAALGLTRQYLQQELIASFRYRFLNRMWFGAQATMGRQLAFLRYGTAGTAYDTSTPPVLALSIQYGVPLGGGP